MDCSLPGSSVHGISQARTLEWGCHFNMSDWPKSLFGFSITFYTKAQSFWLTHICIRVSFMYMQCEYEFSFSFSLNIFKNLKHFCFYIVVVCVCVCHPGKSFIIIVQNLELSKKQCLQQDRKALKNDKIRKKLLQNANSSKFNP